MTTERAREGGRRGDGGGEGEGMEGGEERGWRGGGGRKVGRDNTHRLHTNTPPVVHHLTYPLIHNIATLRHLYGVDVAPGTLHPQHLTVDLPYQQFPHLPLQTPETQTVVPSLNPGNSQQLTGVTSAAPILSFRN